MGRKDSSVDKMTDEEFEKIFSPCLPVEKNAFNEKNLGELILWMITTCVLFFGSLLMLVGPPHSMLDIVSGCFFGMFFMAGFLSFFIKLATQIWGCDDF